ncbi:MAG: tRNA (N6-threonylcarbamoyladenosine(37)-N6)-methyltransferase TrmO [Candidatus Melainabacteria bacterium HGW-Melainabacteria-1]|nr:MAG: tRNA (N6-threonylcarbamoyladenosine(37)-N6)-methyltransferase TrmO [Candidatus Melainabacteria bacterium HGW-Melainabacteria-1]
MFKMSPVARVRSPRTTLADDGWGQIESEIVLDEALAAECFDGLEAFSHLEIIYVFDRVAPDQIVAGAEHPRENPAWPKVGIFAQRKKNRPNRLGLTTVELLAREGRSLHVRGLDAIDGTPVLDIKPVMAEFLPRGPLRQPDWSHALMSHYW